MQRLKWLLVSLPSVSACSHSLFVSQALEAQVQELSLREATSSKAMSGLQEAQKELQSAKTLLGCRDDEIAGLKDTIRRECEERTMMMIQVGTC